MLRDLTLPVDGPAEPLAELARRRGLRYSRAHVRAAVERHPNPGSLLALVEVAPTLGLETSAGRGDLESLDALGPDELPAVLHFESETGGGFGLLERVTPEGFLVWDRRAGSRLLGRDELEEAWSGVIVFAEPGAPGIPERGQRLHRAREWLLEDGQLATALVGPSSSRPLRAAMGLGLLVLLGMAVLAQPAPARVAIAVLAALVVVGLGASVAALRWTRDGATSALCGNGGRIDCGSVLRSPYARLAGIPLAGLGVAFFGALLLLLGASALAGGAASVWLTGAAFVPAAPASLALIAVQARLRHFCALCLIVHGVNLAGAVAFLLLVPGGPPAGVLPAFVLLAVLFGLLLSTVVPELARTDEDQGTVLRAYRRLSRSPLATLAELTLEPRMDLEPGTLAVPFGPASAPHTLLVLAHPSCHLCGPVVDGLEALVRQHPGTVRGALVVAPRDAADPRDQALCEALYAVGLAAGGIGLLSAFRLAKRELPRLLASDPFEVLAAELRVERVRLDREREHSRARVRAAADFKARHAAGLPAMFLDGRRCEAPLEHVEAWFGQPELLALLPRPGVPTSEAPKLEAPRMDA